METNLHLTFASGKCREAFAFYEKTFNSKIMMTMTYGEAPGGSPVPEAAKDSVLHTSMKLGSILLMGCDDFSGRSAAPGGFQIAVTPTDEAEVRRLFTTLGDGGSVQMPLAPTFWSPLFGMCTDKFGIGWMVGLPGPQQ